MRVNPAPAHTHLARGQGPSHPHRARYRCTVPLTAANPLISNPTACLYRAVVPAAVMCERVSAHWPPRASVSPALNGSMFSGWAVGDLPYLVMTPDACGIEVG